MEGRGGESVASAGEALIEELLFQRRENAFPEGGEGEGTC